MLHYQFFPEYNFMLSVFYGEVLPEELSNHVSELSQFDAKGKKVIALSVLCKNLKFNHIGMTDILKSGKVMRGAPYRTDGTHAILAKTTLAYGFSRGFQVASDLEGIDDTKVYKEDALLKALAWLGIAHLASEIETLIDSCESPR